MYSNLNGEREHYSNVGKVRLGEIGKERMRIRVICEGERETMTGSIRARQYGKEIESPKRECVCEREIEYKRLNFECIKCGRKIIKIENMKNIYNTFSISCHCKKQ